MRDAFDTYCAGQDLLARLARESRGLREGQARTLPPPLGPGAMDWYAARESSVGIALGTRPNKRKGRKVRCVETGIVYDDCHAAKYATGTTAEAVSAACNRGHLSGGCHWEWASRKRSRGRM